MTEETHRESGTLACGCNYVAVINEFGLLTVSVPRKCPSGEGECKSSVSFGVPFAEYKREDRSYLIEIPHGKYLATYDKE